MELECEIETDKKRLTISSGEETAALYTPGERKCVILNIGSTEVLDELELKAEIVNAEFHKNDLYLFTADTVEVYSCETRSMKTKNFKGITSLFYGYKKENFTIDRDGNLFYCSKGKEDKKVECDYFQKVGNKYLVIINKAKVDLYRTNAEPMKIKYKYFGILDRYSGSYSCDIRNNKLYVMKGERLVGRDLNLITSDANMPGSTDFRLLNDGILLFDKNRELLKVFASKSAKNCIIECPASSYYYSAMRDKLYVISNGKLAIHSKIDIYKIFTHTEGYAVYSEKEDEFDESDSEFADFVE
ncbi:hypothetical protein ENBRE01_1342 [Enteropsectra breve]|nr:hypothetical protein ENBRE01_1342 [Enteropsectra breve]